MFVIDAQVTEHMLQELLAQTPITSSELSVLPAKLRLLRIGCLAARALLLMKVSNFDLPGSFASLCVYFIAVIVEALLRGYKDGMDILTLSLGGVDGWTEGMGAVVASRIAAKGKVVTIAAGNGESLWI